MDEPSPAHDSLLHVHSHDNWPPDVPLDEPHGHAHTGPGHGGIMHSHEHRHASAGLRHPLSAQYSKTGPIAYRDAVGRLLSDEEVSAEVAALAGLMELGDRLVPRPGPGQTAELVAGQLKRAVDQDPRAKRIASLEQELTQHRRIVHLLVERLGGHVLIPDIDLMQVPPEGTLTWWESRADCGWHLSTRGGPNTPGSPEG